MSNTTYANWNHAREITVPLWLLESEARLRSQPYPDDPSKMALVFECARLNVQWGSGAPLAAAVFDANGLLISVGVDAPGIGGHEMTNALMLASNLWGSQELRQRSDWEMFSLAPPCSVCLGNIYSEVPSRFVCAISHNDLLAQLDLPNTPFPSGDWRAQLHARDVQVEEAVAREEGIRILEGFRNSVVGKHNL